MRVSALLFVCLLEATCACQQDTVHCSFSVLPALQRRLISSLSDNFCVTEGSSLSNYQLHIDADAHTGSYNLLATLLASEMIPMPPSLYIKEGKVDDPSEVTYLVVETNSTSSRQWIVARGLNILYRASDTSSPFGDDRIVVDTKWEATPTAAEGGLHVTQDVCPTPATTASPTPMPTALPTSHPTPAHPCTSGAHQCDTTNGKCVEGSASDSARTSTTADGHVFHCACTEGFVFSDASNPSVNTCIATPAPTPAPTTSPTSMPTALPTSMPTSMPTPATTASPTPMPTALPTSHPTPAHPCTSGAHQCDTTNGKCVEGSASDSARTSTTADGHVFHCACTEGFVFSDASNPSVSTCIPPSLNGDSGIGGPLNGGVESATADTTTAGAVGANSTVLSASAGVVGVGLLVAGLAARRKREDKDDEEEEAKRRRIVWSDSMDRGAFDDSSAKAAAQQEALQMGMQMGMAMANDKADSSLVSSGLFGRENAALGNVTLDDGGEEENGEIPAWMMSGWVVDKKEIDYLKDIGQGAFGAVSLVRVRGTLMAAKRLNPNAENEEATREELLKEVKAMAELQHTNVVRIFGVCMDPGHICVLMEFAAGGTARDLLDKARKEGQPLPTYAIFNLMRDVVLGMRHAHAHEPAILHRDLKSANILITEEGNALVSDFGLATDCNDEEQGGGGTLAYSPPEVLEAMAAGTGESGWSVDGDVFSFGVLAWELVTGDVPYKGANARRLFKSVVGDGKRPHGKTWEVPLDNCDPFLADVIKRCWAQNHEDRPSFKELSEEFEKMSAEPRFQTPDNIYNSLDDLVNSQSAQELMSTLKGLEEQHEVKIDVQKVLAEHKAKAAAAGDISAVEQAKSNNDEAKNVLTETFANFYSNVFGNNKADEEDDLESMV